MPFDFDDGGFDFELASSSSGRERAWAVSCDPAPATRNKLPRGPGRRRKKSRPAGVAAGSAQEGLEGLDLPPFLQKYGVRHKYDFSGPSLLGVENDEGKVEYKLRLKPDLTRNRFHQLVTQLKYRLSEGEGECYYLLGVEDNGHPMGLDSEHLQQSLGVLRSMAAEVGAGATLLRTPSVEGGRQCAVVLVKRRCEEEGVDYVDLRVAVAGGVDSGKSTLVAVLTHGADGRPLLDDGRGSARMAVFQHKHEIETGHTSSLTQQMLGYDTEGNVINYAGVASYTPSEVALCAARVVRFVDTGGHEKYSKTALAGMTCMLPDYAMLCVCSVAGLGWATREHLAVALALGVPAFVALTKADMVDESALDCLVQDVRYLVGTVAGEDPASALNGLGAVLAPTVETEEEARQLAPRMLHSHVGPLPPAAVAGASAAGEGGPRLMVPIFKLSSVTGQGLAALHAFLHALPPEVARATAGEAPAAAAAGEGTPAAAEGAAVSAEVAEQLGSLTLQEAAAASSPPDMAQGWFRLRSSGSVPVAGAPAQPGSNAAAGPAAAAAAAAAAALAAPGGPAQAAAPVHFLIDHSLFVGGVGPVYSGRVVSGAINVGSRLLLGPCLENGAFRRAVVVGLHRSQLPVGCIRQGEIATVAVQLEGEEGQGEGKRRGLQGECGVPAAAGAAAGPALVPADAPAGAMAVEAAPAVAQPAGGPEAACGVEPAPRPGSEEAAAVLPPGGLARSLAGTGWELSEHLGAASQGPGARPSRAPSEARPAFPKGSVLLDPALQPEACWELEAMLVLLGGHWPARGLMSGRWPPEEEEEGEGRLEAGEEAFGFSPAPAIGSSGSMQARGSAKSLLRRAAAPAMYTVVVHCGSVRQAAQVESIQELPLSSPAAGHPLSTAPHDGLLDEHDAAAAAATGGADGGRILPALAAARLLRAEGWLPLVGAPPAGSHGSLWRPGDGGGSGGGRSARQEGQRSASASSPGDAICGGVPVPRPRASIGGRGLMGDSPCGSVLGGSQGALSSAWSGDSGALSYASSDSYDSSTASEGGGGGSLLGASVGRTRSRRRVGWADAGSDVAQQESSAATAPEDAHGQALQQPQPQPQAPLPPSLDRQSSSGRPGLLRHRSLSAARHDPDLGCLARVRLRFVKRPEWVVEGARLVVRDRSGGRAAAVGYVLGAAAPAGGVPA